MDGKNASHKLTANAVRTDGFSDSPADGSLDSEMMEHCRRESTLLIDWLRPLFPH